MMIQLKQIQTRVCEIHTFNDQRLYSEIFIRSIAKYMGGANAIVIEHLN
jgi:hypothetical protein